MPYFRNLEGFQQSASRVFSQILMPAGSAPLSGIYCCVSCGFEIVAVKDGDLPKEETCSGHEVPWKGQDSVVRWRLLATSRNTNG